MSYQKFPFLLSKSFKKKRKKKIKKRKSVSFCVRKVKDFAPGSSGFSAVMGFLFIYLFIFALDNLKALNLQFLLYQNENYEFLFAN